VVWLSLLLKHGGGFFSPEGVTTFIVARGRCLTAYVCPLKADR